MAKKIVNNEDSNKLIGEVEVENTTMMEEEETINPLDRFFKMETVIEGLHLAMRTGKNIVLWGPGGHGKSEVVLAFLEQLGIEPFVKVLGKGTSIDDLFGGINLKKFQEHGEIEYLTDNSFMKHKVVVFEEMMDCQPEILETLKDVLTSKKLRNGNNVVPLDTQIIICCTNTNRKDYAKNASIEALLERFPLDIEVKWPSYQAPSYDQLFEKRFGRTNETLSFICAEISKKREGKPISPRIAIAAYDIVEITGGYGGLEFLADFKENIEVVKNAMKKFEQMIELRKFRDDFAAIKPRANALSKVNVKDIEDTSEIEATAKDLANIYNRMNKYKAHDDVTTEYNAIFKDVKAAHNICQQILTTLADYKENIKNSESLLSQAIDFE